MYRIINRVIINPINKINYIKDFGSMSSSKDKMNNKAQLKKDKSKKDNYTEALLKERFYSHKSRVIEDIEYMEKYKIKIRLPVFPEDISENIIKFIINNKLSGDSIWSCDTGDLYSTKEGIQECKCFTSSGPSSFSPTSNWDVIYFLDGRQVIPNNFILYRIPLKKDSEEWKKIKINKKETFEDQCKGKRRPRINWASLYPQISQYCEEVYNGSFEQIFLPSEEVLSNDVLLISQLE